MSDYGGDSQIGSIRNKISKPRNVRFGITNNIDVELTNPMFRYELLFKLSFVCRKYI